MQRLDLEPIVDLKKHAEDLSHALVGGKEPTVTEQTAATVAKQFAAFVPSFLVRPDAVTFVTAMGFVGTGEPYIDFTFPKMRFAPIHASNGNSVGNEEMRWPLTKFFDKAWDDPYLLKNDSGLPVSPNIPLNLRLWTQMPSWTRELKGLQSLQNGTECQYFEFSVLANAVKFPELVGRALLGSSYTDLGNDGFMPSIMHVRGFHKLWFGSSSNVVTRSQVWSRPTEVSVGVNTVRGYRSIRLVATNQELSEIIYKKDFDTLLHEFRDEVLQQGKWQLPRGKASLIDQQEIVTVRRVEPCVEGIARAVLARVLG